MKTAEIYEIGEQVLIPARIVKREFDDRGNIKYTLKDDKTGKILEWYYTRKDLITVPTPKKKKEVEK